MQCLGQSPELSELADGLFLSLSTVGLPAHLFWQMRSSCINILPLCWACLMHVLFLVNTQTSVWYWSVFMSHYFILLLRTAEWMILKQAKNLHSVLIVNGLYNGTVGNSVYLMPLHEIWQKNQSWTCSRLTVKTESFRRNFGKHFSCLGCKNVKRKSL